MYFTPNTVLNNLHATVVFVGYDVCNFLLVLMVRHANDTIGGACHHGTDLIFESNETKLTRVNTTLLVGLGRIMGIRQDQPFLLVLIPVPHIDLGV